MDDQTRFWNDWNAATREKFVSETSRDQAATALSWLAETDRRDLAILDVGCGAGWMCDALSKFGTVTGTDLADEVLARAAGRYPQVRFIAGDFMTLRFDECAYDAIVCFEVVAHVHDQPGFLRKLAALLKPGGTLILSSQNPWVLRRSDVDPAGKGQVRRWVSQRELRTLLRERFHVRDVATVTPHGDKGLLRVVNSVKLTRALSAMIGQQRVRQAKERAGLGRTIIVRAERRSDL
jgi:2-polyprenyl-3-methyl-5-hydroxy-6-metoxy-1,4-benzoquinol methylase